MLSGSAMEVYGVSEPLEGLHTCLGILQLAHHLAHGFWVSGDFRLSILQRSRESDSGDVASPESSS